MKDCQGELLQRVRRGLASSQEQVALEVHLKGCESCCLTTDLMGDFDMVGEAAPGDFERVAAMASQAAASRGRGVPTRFRASRTTLGLAVAALVLSGVAAAGVAVRLSEKGAPKPGVRTNADMGERLSVTSSASQAPVPEGPAEREQTSSITFAPRSGESEKGKLSSSPSKVSEPFTSAQEVYREANDARRAGRSSEAISGYQKLQRQFPRSPEAHAARVSLGGLLLRSGAASGALAQFDAYLAAGGGQLAAEALFGRGQALRALGRSAEEEQNLNRLVSNYPRSAYATHAQRRLLELR